MTDVRDRDTPTELKVDVGAPARQPLVARAPAPAKRGKSQLPAPHGAFDPQGGLAPGSKPRRRFGLGSWSFIGLVLLPIMAAGAYLFFVARDQYTAEASFAVRQAESIASTDLLSKTGGSGGSGESSQAAAPSGGSILSGTVNLGGQDAEIVANYIHSRAIIDAISPTLDIRAIYTRPEADFFAKLPGQRDRRGADRLLEQDGVGLHPGVVGHRHDLRVGVPAGGCARSRVGRAEGEREAGQ